MSGRVVGVVCGLVLLTAFAAACGGSDENYEGAAALAVAQYFDQEAAAGALPEGTVVRPNGSKSIVVLETEGDATARVCVEFEYIRAQTPFDRHYRVYVATLQDDAWNIEAVNPDGTCEGVA